MTTIAVSRPRFTLRPTTALDFYEVYDSEIGQGIDTIHGRLFAEAEIRLRNLQYMGANASGAVKTIIRDVQYLIAGKSPFNTMTVEQRAEQLQSILGAIESAPSLLFPALKKLPDQTIIGIVSAEDTPAPLLFEATAELCRRCAAPTSGERAEIEQRIECEAAQQPDPYDCVI